MQIRRGNALKELKSLAEKLTKSQVVSSDRTLQEGTDRSKSWLPDINKWIAAINSKVREQLIHS